MLLPSLLLSACFLASTGRATVDADVLYTLQRVAGYAGSAYCPLNYGLPAAKATTFSSNPYDAYNSTQIAYPFLEVGKSETSGLIMIDHTHQSIVISFRGTTDSEDWDTNLDFFPTDASIICDSGCKVHRGFLHAWNDVSALVMENWIILQVLYPGYDTIITGHSLGGALAHVCAAALKHASPTSVLSLYTYASPRVGNQAFANYINGKFGMKNYRMTHLNDPVPRLPGRLLGFVHSSPEYHITSPHIKNVLSASKAVLTQPANLIVLPTDVPVLTGPESSQGNIGYTCTNIDIHDEYFMQVAGCVATNSTSILETMGKDICHIFLVCCDKGINSRALEG